MLTFPAEIIDEIYLRSPWWALNGLRRTCRRLADRPIDPADWAQSVETHCELPNGLWHGYARVKTFRARYVLGVPVTWATVNNNVPVYGTCDRPIKFWTPHDPNFTLIFEERLSDELVINVKYSAQDCHAYITYQYGDEPPAYICKSENVGPPDAGTDIIGHIGKSMDWFDINFAQYMNTLRAKLVDHYKITTPPLNTLATELLLAPEISARIPSVPKYMVERA